MLKSPMDYFAAQDFSVKPAIVGALTESEALFMRKYLGVGDMPMPGFMPVPDGSLACDAPVVNSASVLASGPAAVPVVVPAAPAVDASSNCDEELALRAESSIQFVGFGVGRQQYTLPTCMVQEVIRALPASQLPMVSPFVSGVINLRNRVVPLVRLEELLDVPGTDDEKKQAPFTIICRGRGMQVGLQISRVHNMYRIPQEQIQWNVESTLGVNGECITGIFLLDERIMPILSVQRIVDCVLNK